MRVIGGVARGRRLQAPADRDIRPTLDRVREALFNILAAQVPGARFLDLFAGTGAIGIEALSRGAAEVVFVDAERSALDLVRANLRATGLEGRVQALQFRLPEGLGKIHGPFEIIYADPPHAWGDFSGLLAAVGSAGLLAPDGVFVLEHSRRTEAPEHGPGLARYRQARYGETILSFYERPDN